MYVLPQISIRNMRISNNSQEKIELKGNLDEKCWYPYIKSVFKKFMKSIYCGEKIIHTSMASNTVLHKSNFCFALFSTLWKYFFVWILCNKSSRKINLRNLYSQGNPLRRLDSSVQRNLIVANYNRWPVAFITF